MHATKITSIRFPMNYIITVVVREFISWSLGSATNESALCG